MPPSHSPKPTMLLTKRLTVFLSSNTSSYIPTLLLLTPTGKVLALSSPSPASVLRTQGTLATTLWNLYSSPSTSTTISASLPPDSQTASLSRNFSKATAVLGSSEPSSAVTKSILIQLEYGIMVIRSLQCGLLFVAIGPSPNHSQSLSHPTSATSSNLPSQTHSPHSPPHSHTHPQFPQQTPQQIPQSGSSPPTTTTTYASTSPPNHSHELSPQTHETNDHLKPHQQGEPSFSTQTTPFPSNQSLAGTAIFGSETGSVRADTASGGGMGGGGVGILGIRRQVEEIGRSLDGKLAGFRMDCES